MARSFGLDNTESPDDFERSPATGVAANVSDQRLARFAADARIDDAIRARSRQRWLRQQSWEDSSIASLCVHLAEIDASATLHCVDGRLLRGRIHAVGVDFLELSNAASRTSFVPLAVVAALETLSPLAGGGRRLPTAPTLSDVLSALADAEEQLTCSLLGSAETGGRLSGRVRWANEELFALQGEGKQVAYVRLSSVAVLSVTPSG